MRKCEVLKYRKEIDGLRSIAVIPVILFHGGFEWLSGGYIGVDVFFVISGFLITSIILKELDAGTFTITNFYERRARRILPALFFVLLVTLPFAWFWLLPYELKDFGKSIIAVNLFSSNILFWLESNYFAAAAESIPLLHTWTLAVEEQFYIIFPVFMMLFWGLGKRGLAIAVAIIALLSLGLSEWGWREFPEANFYLLPARAWELMIGSLVAFYLQSKSQPKGIINHWASFLGLALIIIPMFLFDKGTPFPSMYALAPTVGTALIILYTTPDTLVYRLLSLRFMVGIGLISYSAYLWHQPLFVFARLISLEEPSLWLMGALSIVALGLSYLSWRFVEAPFRNKQRFSRKFIFVGSFVISLAFIAIGAALVLSEGAANRF